MIWGGGGGGRVVVVVVRWWLVVGSRHSVRTHSRDAKPKHPNANACDSGVTHLVDRNVDKFDEETNKAHDHHASAGGERDADELCEWGP